MIISICEIAIHQDEISISVLAIQVNNKYGSLLYIEHRRGQWLFDILWISLLKGIVA